MCIPRVCDMTAQEIMRIEKNQRKTNRKIAQLQKELMFCKNSLEVKVMSERLLGKQVSVSNKLGFNFLLLLMLLKAYAKRLYFAFVLGIIRNTSACLKRYRRLLS